MDFTPSLEAKGFYRFTGPPENWLTAIKFMTWGLEEKYRDRWAAIQPGDIFFIHSTGAQTSLFSNARSGIIGMGVVGPHFSIKEDFLWIHEQKEKRNIWPLLVPFSEIYLFSGIPSAENWEAPNPDNGVKTRELIDQLLSNYIPLSELDGFPQMGSFSAVSQNVAKQILYDRRPLHVIEGQIVGESLLSTKHTELKDIKSADEALRYADTLRVFDKIKKRVVAESPSQYLKNNELLARAENVHSTILQSLIDIFRSHGYETLSNRFVDLFAHNEKRSFLIDVKSIENQNFRAQARKGIVQLFEYDYFEVRKFVSDNEFKFADSYKLLVPSKTPEDEGYVGFINDLKVGVGVVDRKSIRAVGTDFGFSKV